MGTEIEIARKDLISDDYIDLNVKLHLKWPTYGGGGYKWANAVCELGFTDILDYGCGKGTLKEWLVGRPEILVREYDPAIPGKNTWPTPADLVVCTDVMEHLEPEKLDMVLVHLRYLIRKKGFFVIATREANKTLRDGRNAHLIIQPIEWWQDKLKMFFKIESVTNTPEEGEYVVIVS